jgi:hypothetical protein
MRRLKVIYRLDCQKLKNVMWILCSRPLALTVEDKRVLKRLFKHSPVLIVAINCVMIFSDQSIRTL